MKQNYLAFDIGGTTIKYSVMNNELNSLYSDKVSTNHNKDSHIIKALQEITLSMQNKYNLVGIGVSTAGIVGQKGEIKYAGPTIPNYVDTPIKSTLEKISGLKTEVINDVDAALLGEVFTSKINEEGVYCIALGTGIGGSFIQSNKIFSGVHGKANSIGYTLIDKKNGTNYEQRASTLALEDKLKKYGVSVIEAFEKAKQQENPYKSIISSWAYEVARGIAEVIVLFDPQEIIIGGAVSAQGKYLTDLLNIHLNSLLPIGFKQTHLSTACQGNKAQLIGSIVPFLR